MVGAAGGHAPSPVEARLSWAPSLGQHGLGRGSPGTMLLRKGQGKGLKPTQAEMTYLGPSPACGETRRLLVGSCNGPPGLCASPHPVAPAAPGPPKGQGPSPGSCALVGAKRPRAALAPCGDPADPGARLRSEALAPPVLSGVVPGATWPPYLVLLQVLIQGFLPRWHGKAPRQLQPLGRAAARRTPRRADPVPRRPDGPGGSGRAPSARGEEIGAELVCSRSTRASTGWKETARKIGDPFPD